MSQTNITCRICTADSPGIFKSRVLAKYDVAYFECPRCRFVQTEQPYWLTEAYARSINMEDTGIVWRNQMCSDRFAPVLISLFGPNAKYVDFAGGYGLFTRMMRDRGFDYYWHDAYTENLVARGFEFASSTPVDAVTTFESFEHFVDPLAELKKLLALGDAIFLSTELAPTPTPKADQWWYYGHSHGQHIAFYRTETLEHLAQATDSMCVTNGTNLHGFIKIPRLPYALPESFYKRLSAELGAEFDALYERVDSNSGMIVRPSWREVFRRSKRKKHLYVLKDAANADGVVRERLRTSPVFADYLRHLLTDAVGYWEPFLRAKLVPRMLSDMELIVARDLSSP
jgi:hypothetical protein